MSPQYDLSFEEGAPIDAGKLQQLVTYLNDVNTKAVKLPDVKDLAGQVVANTMVAGITEEIEIKFMDQAKEVPVQFEPYALTNVPASVIATLQSPSSDLDLVSYIKPGSASQTGFILMVNRVAGVEGKKTSVSDKTYKIKVHYFALAKSS